MYAFISGRTFNLPRLMYMSPKLKERFEFTGWAIVTSLLSVCVYFLVRLNDKIDYSYKANVEQMEINKSVKESLEKYETAIMVNDARMDKISERFYSLEAIIKYSHDKPN